MTLNYTENSNAVLRNGIFPVVSINNGCHSHQQLYPQLMVSWWALRKLRKEKNTCHPAALRLQPLPAVSPRSLQMWKHGMLVPESWGAYQMNDFSEPRLLHIPKHRKVLNSWDMWFSLINKNLLIDVQTTCPLLQNFYMTWLLVSPFQSSSLRVTWDAEVLGLEILKTPTK